LLRVSVTGLAVVVSWLLLASKALMVMATVAVLPVPRVKYGVLRKPQPPREQLEP
jgi:hypothetical protein